MQKLLTFSAQILAYMLYLKIKRFNETLTNDIFSFEQLGLDVYHDVVIDAQRKKLALMSYANNGRPGCPAFSCSLIRPLLVADRITEDCSMR